ncbi:MAG TPA: hypothetical protein DCW89_09160 [Oceanospirillaceae bacterium]|nr:hypothetical protein [Oceanospirillaceae bacterium]
MELVLPCTDLWTLLFRVLQRTKTSIVTRILVLVKDILAHKEHKNRLFHQIFGIIKRTMVPILGLRMGY